MCMTMMCKCCDGNNTECKCMHHKMPILEGLVVVVLGVVLFFTNYGLLDANVWGWLLPLVIVVCGLKWMAMCGGMMKKK